MKSAVCTPVIVGLLAFTAMSGGVAYADPPPGTPSGPSEPGQGLAEFKKRMEMRKTLQARSEIDKKAAVDLDELMEAPDAVLAASASSAWIPGGSVPTVGMGGLVPNARSLAGYIMATYPGVQSIGGVRADPIPDHPSGHAIDIMIGSDMGLGDAINADVQGKAGRFGVSYTLWRVADHFNHVHVTVF